MSSGFTFERALAFPFTAPHFGSFPWVFGAAYAACFMGVSGILTAISWPMLAGWVAAVDSVPPDAGADEALAMIRESLFMFLPIALIGGLAAWTLWAMFETASQRRYIWGQPFSLGFGADEARMMVVGLLWWLISVVIYAVPAFLIVGSLVGAAWNDLQMAEGGQPPSAFAGAAVMAPGLILLLIPLYIFVATRLAPCFGMTVKDGRIRFFEAWAVSRGRFWPILMAYVILMLGGGIAAQIVQGMGQLMLLPALMEIIRMEPSTPAEVTALLTRPGFLVPAVILAFMVLFMQGLIQHAVGGPAALAARNDPSASVDDLSRIDSFR